METQRKTVTVPEAAVMLGVTERTVHTYLKERKLTELRDPSGGGRPRLYRDEVENFFRPVTGE